MGEATKFIDELPKKIAWLKKENIADIIKKDSERIDKEYQSCFFEDWANITDNWSKFKDTEVKAHLASEIVFHELLDGKQMYEHYENPLSYELSEDAKTIREIACDVYNYVIWLQLKDLFPKARLTRDYCKKRVSRWLK